MAIDPVAAAADAIAAYLQANVTGLTARRGWPEGNVELDLGAGPVAAVTPGPREDTPCSPREVDRTGSGTLTLTYRVAELDITAQLDVWAAYRAVRDDTVAAIEAKLHNRLPFQPGLWLTSTGYFNRPLTIESRRISVPDSEDTAPAGEWRATWELRIRSDLVVQTTKPEIVTTTLRTSTDLSNITVTEPDRDVT
jgi:hypothetical protein